jgi:hypothetical protein
MTSFEARQNGSQGHDGIHQIIGFAVNFGQITPLGQKSGLFRGSPAGARIVAAVAGFSHAVTALVVHRGLG